MPDPLTPSVPEPSRLDAPRGRPRLREPLIVRLFRRLDENLAEI